MRFKDFHDSLFIDDFPLPCLVAEGCICMHSNIIQHQNFKLCAGQVPIDLKCQILVLNRANVHTSGGKKTLTFQVIKG